MTSAFKLAEETLRSQPRTWLVTGAAGFIGSNLVEYLLRTGQKVRGLDNFATGHQRNLDEVMDLVGTNATNFEFIHGDIADQDAAHRACQNVDHVLHQAALGSVPRSIADPIATNRANVTGYLNMLDAARQANVRSFVYAASSSTYGDHPALPKIEDRIGRPLSPYAVTKLVNELYASVYDLTYNFKATGLRYFNVFGPRQDPDGAYAAVIPKWISSLLDGEATWINGDGETSRDFCYIDNVVQANILASLAPDESKGQVYNVAVGERTTLNELHKMLEQNLAALGYNINAALEYRDFRPGDVRHSQASIEKAKDKLGYSPSRTVAQGLKQTMPWYVAAKNRSMPARS